MTRLALAALVAAALPPSSAQADDVLSERRMRVAAADAYLPVYDRFELQGCEHRRGRGWTCSVLGYWTEDGDELVGETRTRLYLRGGRVRVVDVTLGRLR